MIAGLSVAIITFNEEKKIEKTLKAVSDMTNDIVIVDSFSQDKTIDIAEKYGARVFSEKWKGYGAQKNSAIEKCKNKWILLIDADEVVSEDLKQELYKIVNENNDIVYEINRCSICFGKEIKYGGWSKDYVVRLFKKGSGQLDNAVIHEKFITDYKIKRIDQKLYHYTYLDLEEYFSKFNKYTTAGAIRRNNRNKKATLLSIIFNPIFKFFKMYILKLGILDGLHGFILAVFAYIYNFVIQVKLYMLQKEKGKEI